MEFVKKGRPPKHDVSMLNGKGDTMLYTEFDTSYEILRQCVKNACKTKGLKTRTAKTTDGHLFVEVVA